MKLISLFLLFALTLHGEAFKTKKIVIESFVSKKDAKILQLKLTNDSYIKQIIYDYGLKLRREDAVNNRTYIVLKPFHNEALISKIISEIRKRYPKAFLQKYFDDSSTARPYVLGPFPKKRVPPIEKPVIREKEVEKPLVIEQEVVPIILEPVLVKKPIEPEKKTVKVKKELPKDYAQYLRKNDEKEPQNSNVLIYIIGTITLLLLMIFLIRHFRRKSEESHNLDTILFNESAVTEDTVYENFRFEALKVDVHSHLIPGIDDGAQTVEEATILVQKLKSIGYTKLIVTPHTMMHRFANTTQSITDGLKVLKIALLKQQIIMDIEVASEYYLDEHLMDLVQKRDILTFGDNYLLFEMSYVNHPVNYELMIQKIIDAGYKPVLAHPERYLYMGRNFDKYVSLRILGVYLQLNINSIGGYYSPEVQKNARRLVSEGMISFLGSDTHRLKHSETLEKIINSDEYRDIFSKNLILNNTLL